MYKVWVKETIETHLGTKTKSIPFEFASLVKAIDFVRTVLSDYAPKTNTSISVKIETVNHISLY